MDTPAPSPRSSWPSPPDTRGFAASRASCTSRISSIGARAAEFDDFLPFGDFGIDEYREFLWHFHRRFRSQSQEALPQFGLAQNLCRLPGETIYDRPGRVGGREHPAPAGELVAR